MGLEKPDLNAPSCIESNKEARQWAMFAHLAGPLSLLIGVGFAGLGFVGPLVIWLIKKYEFPFVDDQGKEALNFQISVTIYLFGCAMIACTGIGMVVAIPLLLALGLFDLVVTVVAAIKANEGIAYRYPLCIRILS